MLNIGAWHEACKSMARQIKIISIAFTDHKMKTNLLIIVLTFFGFSACSESLKQEGTLETQTFALTHDAPWCGGEGQWSCHVGGAAKVCDVGCDFMPSDSRKCTCAQPSEGHPEVSEIAETAENEEAEETTENTTSVVETNPVWCGAEGQWVCRVGGEPDSCDRGCRIMPSDPRKCTCALKVNDGHPNAIETTEPTEPTETEETEATDESTTSVVETNPVWCGAEGQWKCRDAGEPDSCDVGCRVMPSDPRKCTCVPKVNDGHPNAIETTETEETEETDESTTSVVETNPEWCGAEGQWKCRGEGEPDSCDIGCRVMPTDTRKCTCTPQPNDGHPYALEVVSQTPAENEAEEENGLAQEETDDETLPDIIVGNENVVCPPADKKIISFTIDHFEGQPTIDLVDILLDDTGVKPTVFVDGRNLNYGSIIDKAEIGMHGWSHTTHGLNGYSIESEVGFNAENIRHITGLIPRVASFPGSNHWEQEYLQPFLGHGAQYIRGTESSITYDPNAISAIPISGWKTALKVRNWVNYNPGPFTFYSHAGEFHNSERLKVAFEETLELIEHGNLIPMTFFAANFCRGRAAGTPVPVQEAVAAAAQ